MLEEIKKKNYKKKQKKKKQFFKLINKITIF